MKQGTKKVLLKENLLLWKCNRDVATTPVNGLVFRVDEQVDDISFDASTRIQGDRLTDTFDLNNRSKWDDGWIDGDDTHAVIENRIRDIMTGCRQDAAPV